MTILKASTIALFVAFDLVTWPALAQEPVAELQPMQISPPSECHNSGLGQICKWSLPPTLLTEKEVRTILEWHNGHVQQIKKEPQR
jgi:hypothetical protein